MKILILTHKYKVSKIRFSKNKRFSLPKKMKKTSNNNLYFSTNNKYRKNWIYNLAF